MADVNVVGNYASTLHTTIRCNRIHIETIEIVPMANYANHASIHKCNAMWRTTMVNILTTTDVHLIVFHTLNARKEMKSITVINHYFDIRTYFMRWQQIRDSDYELKIM